MIFDRVENLMSYSALLPNLDKVAAFIKEGNYNFEGGIVNLDGDALYVSPFEGIGKERHEAKLEAHRRYVDLQLLIEGSEEIGWTPLSSCHHEVAPYSEEKDIIFYKDPVRDFLKLAPGYFAVFFPEDAHAPLVGEEIKKLVFKFSVE